MNSETKEEDRIEPYDASENVKFWATLKWDQVNRYIGITLIICAGILALISQLEGWRSAVSLMWAVAASFLTILLGVMVLGIKFVEFHNSYANSTTMKDLHRMKKGLAPADVRKNYSEKEESIRRRRKWVKPLSRILKGGYLLHGGAFLAAIGLAGFGLTLDPTQNLC